MKRMSNVECRMSNVKDGGFTLIEILAVIFVLSTIGVLVAAIITSSLRGTNKTNTITAVRQNGFFAIAQMTKMIQNARKLDNPYPCVPPPTPTPQPSHQSITIASADGGQTTLTCNYGSPSTIASNSGSLLDTNAVKLDLCTFTCSQTSLSDPPIIGISFTLTQKREDSFFEQSASIPFQTSVVMRNVSR